MPSPSFGSAPQSVMSGRCTITSSSQCEATAAATAQAAATRPSQRHPAKPATPAQSSVPIRLWV